MVEKSNLHDPEISIDADGVVRSRRTGDIYFSADGGLGETQHVFLGGIGAPDCWQDTRNFCVGELGFGTGLNFLVTADAWLKTAPSDATLDFVSVEGFPISVGDLTRALKPLRGQLNLIDELLRIYPPLLPGVHRRSLAQGRIRLTFLFGDVSDMVFGMTGKVDAWFLDGFSPAKNPDMWVPELLKAVVDRTRPGGRLATFSVAASVRNALAEAGAKVSKRPGYGRKRGCLSAEVPGAATAFTPRSVAVIGAGIAGGCVARSLRGRGHKVAVFDPDVGNGASGNPAALLAPRLPREVTNLGRVVAASFLYAVPFYDGLSAEGGDIWLGARGAFAMARSDDEEDRQIKALRAFGLPPAVMRRMDANEASVATGLRVSKPGLWFAGAGTLSPKGIVRHLLHDIECHSVGVAGLDVKDSSPVLKLEDGREWAFDAVVVAAGTRVPDLLPSITLPIRPNRGQLAYLAPSGSVQRTPVTYGGYLSPEIPVDGSFGHVLGATYARRDEVPEEGWQAVRDEDSARMREALDANLPDANVGAIIGGRTALRATVRDYIPIVGEVADNVFTLGGLGSRGFMTAPLMGEVIADQISDRPRPVDAIIQDAVSPHRFSE